MSVDIVTPLCVRSGYSLVCGTAMPDRLISRACELGHRYLALTDVNGLYGATGFCKLAAESDLNPIIGAQLQEQDVSAVALVASETGYEHLCRIITRIHHRKESTPNQQMVSFPLVSDIAELSEGLHVIVEDGSLARLLVEGGIDRRRIWMGIDPATQSLSHLRRLVGCSRDLHLPLLGMGKALLVEKGDYELGRLLAAIRCGRTYDDPAPGDLPHPNAYLRGGKQLNRELSDFPEAIRNNQRLSEECSSFRLLPRKVVFPGFPCPNGGTPREYLRKLCERGMRDRYGEIPPEAAEARLERELRLIGRLGFAGYFLVVWDIVQYARRRGQTLAGRGSGAGSIVAYTLGITNVCPVTCDIPFERFLHEGREDFPDLDVDFCWRFRDEVIDYAFNRWGEDHVAMVCTHNTFQARSALRETAKAFGFSEEQISRRSDLERDPRLEKISSLSRQLIGLVHLLSVHPGGIVITPGPIDRHVPLQRASKGVLITQYDKDGIEDINLVKLDLLGNRNLSTIRCACELISKRRGKAIDVEKLSQDDPATFALLRSADTIGCNQLESPAMRHLLKSVQPKDTRDVMKVLALIRPGAASVGMKETFIRRRRGLEKVPGGHPQVDAILRETHGVMLYEDDVMLVAAAVTKGSLAEGDRFHKAVQKCSADNERVKLSREFLALSRANGVPDDYAKSLWVQMAKFNAYSFCRAHAASYSLLSYAGAYLKTHYRLEFWTAALNNNQSMYHPRLYVEHAKRGGVRFLLPDVNRSGEEFTIDGGAVRVGLSFVDELGPAGVDRILDERKRREFSHLTDFLYRTALGEAETRSLILCGAFDAFGRTRPALMMELNLFLGSPRDRRGGYRELLSVGVGLPEVARDYTPHRKYVDERRVLGISVREHIMVKFAGMLEGRYDTDSRDLPRCVGKRIRIAGVIEATRTTRTDAGRAMMFLTMDDQYGTFEVTVFPDVYRRAREVIRGYGPYVVTGKVEQQYGVLTITAEHLESVDERKHQIHRRDERIQLC